MPLPTPPGPDVMGVSHPFTLNPKFAYLTPTPVLMAMGCPLLPPPPPQVLTVMGGPESLLHLQSCELMPDLVLLDVMMPEVDGFEVLKRLRAAAEKEKEKTRHLPVIMVSAKVCAW